MENTIIYLIGFPGTGKYTIAKEICKQEKVKLVDSHLINNVVFGLIEQDGITPLPKRIWDNVGKIWDATLDTITHISPKHFNFVLTNFLVDENEDDCIWFQTVQKGAEKRGAAFIPVRMHISLEENEKRIVQPDRKERMKDINPASPKRNSELSILTIDHPNLLNLDVTEMTAKDAAKCILDHAAKCA